MSIFRNPCAEPVQKIIWLKITLAVALICGFVLSWKLWVSSRLFPLSPVSDALPVIPLPLDYVWFFLLLGLLLAISIFAQPRRLIITFLVFAGLLSLFDQTRWQPWFYQYIFMLAALGFYAWKSPEARNHQAAFNACHLILISTYFWSGFQKLNVNFVRETWPDMAGPFLSFLPGGMKTVPSFLILIIPLLEISIGLGLLTRRYRNVSALLAIATHIFVLILLISSGENTVVWPWNIAMALFVFILFWQDKGTAPRQILVTNNIFHFLVLLLFGVLPLFSFIDLWDSYLSASLYSGNTKQAVIYINSPAIDRLPATIYPYIWRSTQPFFLDINRWAYGELNVPVYPEPRIYRKVTAWVCKEAGRLSDIKLRIIEKPNPLTSLRKSVYYDCNHLYLLN